MGTDTTDLIVTNGVKLWLRNIPIGGNHFTKQLSRELKLTQTKAEHLKRNARASENPKAIFKAMRPVFNDFVNEVQRSLTFFESMEKNADLSKIVLLGNAAKLPGLRQYLAKQLDMDIAKVQEFEKLGGNDVTSQKTFSENVLSFAPSYGLCLQGLKKGEIKTNLLPREIVVERIIEAKKPWVLTAICAAMLGLTVGYWFSTTAWFRTTEEFTDSSGTNWAQAFKEVDAKSQLSNNFLQKDEEQKSTLERLNRLSREVTSASEQKSAWLDLQAALAQSFPKDPRIEAAKAEGASRIEPSEIPFQDRKELYVDHIESVYFDDITAFESTIKKFYDRMCTDFEAEVKKALEGGEDLEADAGVDSFAANEPQLQLGLGKGLGKGKGFGSIAATASSVADAPTDGGWVIEIKGHHFNNSPDEVAKLNAQKIYIMKTLIYNLRFKDDVQIPGLPGKFTYSDLGISYPTIVRASATARPKKIRFDPTSAEGSAEAESSGGGGKFSGGGAMSGMGAGGPGESAGGGRSGFGTGTGTSSQEDDQYTYDVREYSFTIQMCWRPRSEAEIVEAREERIAKKAEEAAAEAEANAGDVDPADVE